MDTGQMRVVTFGLAWCVVVSFMAASMGFSVSPQPWPAIGAFFLALYGCGFAFAMGRVSCEPKAEE